MVLLQKRSGIELSEHKFKQLFILVGFTHEFTVLSDFARIEYKVANYYDAELERGMKWDDPSINIELKIKIPILSSMDMNNPSLHEL